jgi:hypothetical protein
MLGKNCSSRALGALAAQSCFGGTKRGYAVSQTQQRKEAAHGDRELRFHTASFFFWSPWVYRARLGYRGLDIDRSRIGYRGTDTEGCCTYRITKGFKSKRTFCLKQERSLEVKCASTTGSRNLGEDLRLLGASRSSGVYFQEYIPLEVTSRIWWVCMDFVSPSATM